MIDERTFGMIYGASFDQLTREDELFFYLFLSTDIKKRLKAIKALKLLIARKISNQTKLWELWKAGGFEE